MRVLIVYKKSFLESHAGMTVTLACFGAESKRHHDKALAESR